MILKVRTTRIESKVTSQKYDSYQTHWRYVDGIETPEIFYEVLTKEEFDTFAKTHCHDVMDVLSHDPWGSSKTTGIAFAFCRRNGTPLVVAADLGGYLLNDNGSNVDKF